MTASGLVTLVGGTGFLGRHVCEAFESAGIPAVSLSHNPDTEFLKRHAPSIRGVSNNSAEFAAVLKESRHVIYLAHRSRPGTHPADLQAEINDNLTSVCNLAETIFSTNPGIRLTYLSSGGQIYGQGHDTPITEDTPTCPTTTYGLGKLLIENALGYYARALNVPIQIQRLGNPVGRWQLNTSHGLVSAAVVCAMNGRSLQIYGKGHNARDYFDADDYAAFLVRQVQADTFTSGTFNIGSGIGLTELDVVDAVKDTLQKPLDCEHQPARDFDLPYAVLDGREAGQTLGWSASTPLSQTIRKLAAASLAD
jgi:UDP-glucose 4-epimerase